MQRVCRAEERDRGPGAVPQAPSWWVAGWAWAHVPASHLGSSHVSAPVLMAAWEAREQEVFFPFHR